LSPSLASSDLETKTTIGKRNMKTITKAILSLQMTALFLTAGLAGAFAAEQQAPFKGSFQAHETYEFDLDAVPPTRSVDGSGSGQATHLGRFTMTYNHLVDLSRRAGVGTAHFIAANGDSVFTEITSFSLPTETPGVVRVVEEHTIVDGTGRFAGATGSFILDRLVDTATGITSGSFEGTIAIDTGN
jgi:hypothetical protein